MEHKTWTTMDKSTWGDGPWSAEVDKEQWTDEATGYACLIKRNPLGALCGYVGVPEGHPWHGSGYSPGYDTEDELSVPLMLLDAAEVHGGLTYADSCQEGPEEATICHVPAPGEPEPLWWFGFDCAHAFDLSPAMRAREREYYPPSLLDMQAEYGLRETYKDIAYVKDQCALLAVQARAATASSPAQSRSTSAR